MSSGEPIGEGGVSVEFRLLYEGRLTTNGNVADKFAIRRQFHPQIRRLCQEHPELHSQFISYGHIEAKESFGQGFTANQAFDCGIKRMANTHLNGFTFLPLSKNEWHLRCGIDVLFLRRENTHGVFMKGDIDNRLKTLFDALQAPGKRDDIGSQVPLDDEDPFYVLLENDKTIADVAITTDRLLQVPDKEQYTSDYVVLVVNVKLRPTRRSAWMHVFD